MKKCERDSLLNRRAGSTDVGAPACLAELVNGGNRVTDNLNVESAQMSKRLRPRFFQVFWADVGASLDVSELQREPQLAKAMFAFAFAGCVPVQNTLISMRLGPLFFGL